MKKACSLFLCLCMLVSVASAFAVPTSAAMVQDIPNADDVPTNLKKSQLIYSEDFEDADLDTSKKNSALITELGWFGSMGQKDSLSIVTNGGNHAVSLTASTTRFDTVGLLRDDRLAGGDYILEYTVHLTGNSLDDPERTFGFCSESASTFSTNQNTAWRFAMKEDGTSDHHLKINANKVIDGGSSLPVKANDGVSASLVGSTYRVRIVVDAEFGVSAYLLDGEKATLFSATTSATSEQWKAYSSTIGNTLFFHILSGITATFDDIQVWTTERIYNPSKLIGYQTTSLANETYDIRFIAGVRSNEAISMGFDVSYSFVQNGKTVRGTKRVYCNYLYETISTDFGRQTLSAKEEGYTYLLALTINDIPSDLAITYTVIPFVLYADSSIPVMADKEQTYSIDRSLLQTAPAFRGGILESTAEFTTNYTRFYYSDTSLSEYREYTDLLTAYGFRLYDENTIDGNVYMTFVSDYIVLHAYYVAYTGSVSILTADIKNWTPYHTAPVSNGKVTDAVLAMASLDYDVDRDGTYNHNNGMGFVYTLEDGSYVIIDGGYAADAATLYQYLKANNKRTDGNILIRAWIITHPDGDHYHCFNTFSTNYANRVTLEQFVAQFDQDHIKTSYASVIQTIYGNVAKYKGCQTVVPMAGQTMYFGTLKVEFLYTAEMYHLYGTPATNESSLAFMATMNGFDVLFGGDITGNALTIVGNIYPTALKCDFLQAPHHALNGTKSFYNSAAPTYLIMCTHKVAADERWNKKRYDGQSQLSYLKGLGIVEAVYVADTGKPEFIPLTVGTSVIPQANPFS